MATAIYPAGRGPASARIRFHDDGTVTVASATSDLGTGSTTALAVLTADELGIPVRRITPLLGDTDLPPGAAAAGSSATGSTTPAIHSAAQAAIKALVDTATTHPDSPFHGKEPDEVRYRNGFLSTHSNDAISFSTLLKVTRTSGVEAVGSSEARTDDGSYAYHGFGAHFCEVRVNRYTGEPRINRFTTVVDVGQVVNAKTTRSQIIGGVIFGIGHALLETNPIEATGRLASSNLGDYLVPVNADIPDLDVHWLNHPDTIYTPKGPEGSANSAPWARQPPSATPCTTPQASESVNCPSHSTNSSTDDGSRRHPSIREALTSEPEGEPGPGSVERTVLPRLLGLLVGC